LDPAIVIPPINVPALLRVHHLRPKKGLGQNFLVDDAALRRVVEAAEITPETTVLEVGPGLGSLTRYLASVAQRVVAVELDSDLLPALRQVLSPYPNVTLLQGDILEQDPFQLMGAGSFSVVANIPYYITSALFRHFLEARVRPDQMVMTVQREVAARLCAIPNDMNLLALSVQVYGVPRIVARIPAGAFYPVPDVDSSVVRVDLLAQPVILPGQLDLFFRLARAAFGQKRKTLRNALSHSLPVPPQQIVDRLLAAGIDPQRRAETVSLAEWKVLTGLVSQTGWLESGIETTR
jgi:16S rRNA (adenine1518-N6/adenine1519-N6)-dimethyltransferase